MSLLGKLTSTLAITNAAGTTVRINRTGGGQAGRSMTLPAAYAGGLTTRTNDTEGTVTAAGHNISTGNTVAVFWTGGSRYGGRPTPSAGSAMPITAATATICPRRPRPSRSARPPPPRRWCSPDRR